MTTPAAALTLAVKSIKSNTESTEMGSDEPYILATAADLTSPVPQVQVTRYGPFDDVDAGETHATLPLSSLKFLPFWLDVNSLKDTGLVRVPFWWLDNNAARAINPATTIFIISVMENDDGDPAAARSLVKGAATISLVNSLQMTLATRVKNLIADISGILATPTGAPNFDDIVGTQQLVLTAADLTPPASKNRVKSLNFSRKDEGAFEVQIELLFS